MLAAALSAFVFVHGVVTMGPTAPVCKVGTPCTKPAAHAEVTFTRTNKVAFAVTDRRGRYHVELAPGYWTVTVSVGMRATPRRIYVPRVARLTRNIFVDTGIR